MPRETRFRGKRIDNGEWAIGNLIGVDCNSVIAQGQFEYDEFHGLQGGDWWHVDPATVGQHTEYLKDINNKFFYEGDIVCLANFPKRIPYLYEVVLADDGFILRSLKIYEDGRFVRRISQFNENLLIIGNRWENPSLLEGEPNA